MMSGVARSFDTERDLPVDVEGRAPQPASCLLCGLEATAAEVWLKPAWWREPGADGKRITTIPRCLDVDACRARVLAAGEAWPLLERGEQPDAKREPPAPVREAPAPPDMGPPMFEARMVGPDMVEIRYGRFPELESAAPVTLDAESPKEEDEWI